MMIRLLLRYLVKNKLLAVWKKMITISSITTMTYSSPTCEQSYPPEKCKKVVNCGCCDIIFFPKHNKDFELKYGVRKLCFDCLSKIMSPLNENEDNDSINEVDSDNYYSNLINGFNDDDSDEYISILAIDGLYICEDNQKKKELCKFCSICRYCNPLETCFKNYIVGQKNTTRRKDLKGKFKKRRIQLNPCKQ